MTLRIIPEEESIRNKRIEELQKIVNRAWSYDAIRILRQTLERDKHHKLGTPYSTLTTNYYYDPIYKYIKRSADYDQSNEVAPIKTLMKILGNHKNETPEDMKHISGIPLLMWTKNKFIFRYRDVTDILRAKQGRCGEFTLLFGAILMSMSRYRVRYIYNFQDHVWIEFRDKYSSDPYRWITVDPSRHWDEGYDCEERIKEWTLHSNCVVALEPKRDVAYRTETYYPVQEDQK